MRKKKKLQRDGYAECASSYVHCFVARDEPHVSVGGLLAWERTTRKNFACKKNNVHRACKRKKIRSRRKQRTSAGRMERCVVKERQVHECAGDNGWKAKGA